MSFSNSELKETKRICAITMVRNDDYFLRKWITYYGSQLGRENLYIFMDGVDQVVPDFCEGVNVTHKEKVYYNSVIESEKRRLAYLSDRARELFERYDVIIGTDADEFLVVDPKLELSLLEYLSTIEGGTSVSGLGVDIGQHLDLEEEIDLSKPLLGQRRFGYLSSRYTKPNTLLRPAKWGSGFHRVKGHNFHIDNNLYLFHFGSMDYNLLERRNRANGWSERHLRKRTRTIHKVTNNPIRDWDEATKFARTMQSFCRLIYAPNKPSMMWLKVIVEIPERFKGIV